MRKHQRLKIALARDLLRNFYNLAFDLAEGLIRSAGSR